MTQHLAAVSGSDSAVQAQAEVVHVERFSYGRPYHRGRSNVTEPLDPRIRLPLLRIEGDWENQPAELALTVPQALEVIDMLMKEIRSFILRRDVAEALTRTEPLHVR